MDFISIIILDGTLFKLCYYKVPIRQLVHQPLRKSKTQTSNDAKVDAGFLFGKSQWLQLFLSWLVVANNPRNFVLRFV